MNFKEAGFRAVYKKFVVIRLEEWLRGSVENFPNASIANCILTYGYIDHEAGLTLEILATGIKTKTEFQFFEGNNTVRSFIRIGAVENSEFDIFEDKDRELRDRYSSKLKILKIFEVSEEIKQTRKMKVLDSCRHAHCIDDVLVYLIKEDLQPEGCWTRIEGLRDNCFVGKLLNEPYQNFDLHLGDKIVFFVQKMKDNKVICLSPVR